MQMEVTVALRCRMGKYSAQLSEESLQQRRSVARPLVYVYTARLGVARQAPAEVERRAQGSQLVPSSTHHMIGALAKRS